MRPTRRATRPHPDNGDRDRGAYPKEFQTGERESMKSRPITPYERLRSNVVTLVNALIVARNTEVILGKETEANNPLKHFGLYDHFYRIDAAQKMDCEVVVKTEGSEIRFFARKRVEPPWFIRLLGGVGSTRDGKL